MRDTVVKISMHVFESKIFESGTLRMIHLSPIPTTTATKSTKSCYIDFLFLFRHANLTPIQIKSSSTPTKKRCHHWNVCVTD